MQVMRFAQSGAPAVLELQHIEQVQAGVDEYLIQIEAAGMLAEMNTKQLTQLAQLIADQTFPLAQAADAHRLLAQRHTAGKLVLSVDTNLS